MSLYRAGPRNCGQPAAVPTARSSLPTGEEAALADSKENNLAEWKMSLLVMESGEHISQCATTQGSICSSASISALCTVMKKAQIIQHRNFYNLIKKKLFLTFLLSVHMQYLLIRRRWEKIIFQPEVPTLLQRNDKNKYSVKARRQNCLKYPMKLVINVDGGSLNVDCKISGVWLNQPVIILNIVKNTEQQQWCRALSTQPQWRRAAGRNTSACQGGTGLEQEGNWETSLWSAVAKHCWLSYRVISRTHDTLHLVNGQSTSISDFVLLVSKFLLRVQGECLRHWQLFCTAELHARPSITDFKATLRKCQTPATCHNKWVCIKIE